MIVIILLLMLIIALLDCLIRKDLRHSVIFAFPIIILIGIYVWLFTLLPVQWGLRRIPFIELVQIRDISANDYTDSQYNYAKHNGVIEFVADKKFDDCEVILEGSNISNLSYNDFMNNDSLAILTSYDVAFIKKVNDKFLYKALFIKKQSNDRKVYDSIYCKVFIIRMFAPIYETNEIAIPYSNYFKLKNRVYNEVEVTAKCCSLLTHY